MLTPALGLSLAIGAVGAVVLAAVANAAQLPPWAIYSAFFVLVAISVTPLGRDRQPIERRRRRR